MQCKNTGQPITNTITFPSTIPAPIHFSKNTLANYPCAKDKAHKRKYEAVLLIDPRTNSIVSII